MAQRTYGIDCESRGPRRTRRRAASEQVSLPTSFDRGHRDCYLCPAVRHSGRAARLVAAPDENPQLAESRAL